MYQLPAQKGPGAAVTGEEIVEEGCAASPLTGDLDHRRDRDFRNLRVPAEHVQHLEPAGSVLHGQRSKEAAAEVVQVGLGEVFGPSRQRTEEPVIAEVVEARRRGRFLADRIQDRLSHGAILTDFPRLPP